MLTKSTINFWQSFLYITVLSLLLGWTILELLLLLCTIVTMFSFAYKIAVILHLFYFVAYFIVRYVYNH